MLSNRLGKNIARCIEGAVAVFLVLVFFLLFLYILNLLFPSGTGLKAVMNPEGSSALLDMTKATLRRLLLAKGDGEADLNQNAQRAAAVALIHETVKSKRADGITWKPAEEGMLLYDRDAVQTLRRSSAVIRFDEDSALQLGERTLVIIQRLEEDIFFRDNRSFLVLVEGELRGRSKGSDQKPAYMKVVTPSAKVRMYTRNMAKGPAEFKIEVNPDKSSTISVYHGSVEVAAQGQKLVVESNQSTRVPINQAPILLKPLPGMVGLKAPQNAHVYYERGRPPPIRFEWQDRPRAAGYHFVLAREPGFTDIVTEERLSAAQFTHAGLKKGTYYWRVSALEEGVEGYFSEIRQFQVRRHHLPPTPTTGFPPETVYYRTLPPQIQFAWKGRSGAGGYHFVLARDPDFHDIVTEKRLSATKFTHAALYEGTYYWRVGIQDKGGEGRFSEARRFRVVQDQKPPLLEVRFPPETIKVRNFTLYGRTEPGANVFVGGYPAAVSRTGEFHFILKIKPGKNVIAVAAVDQANNVSSRSKIVNGKF